MDTTSALRRACVDEFVKSLTLDEKRLFHATTLAETLLRSLEDANAVHKHKSVSRRVMEGLVPFISGVEQYSKALDVFANSNDLLCPIWGGIRVVLTLAMEFGEYFEKIMDMASDIGGLLNRLPRYAHLYPKNDKLEQAIRTIYSAIFDFCSQARNVFRKGGERTCSMKSVRDVVTFASVVRILWKPFSVQFGTIKNRIEKAVGMIDDEADLAERELAAQERQKDESRWNRLEISQRKVEDFVDLEEMTKLDAWLGSANVAANHKAASALRHAETGSWFLEGESFKRWVDTPNSFLWLSAIPGAGKTVLASSIINCINEKLKNPHVGFGYFYCDYRDPLKQTPSIVLGTILAMLARQSKGVRQELNQFFLKQYQESLTFTASFDELRNNFKTFVGPYFDSIIIVVDGLDEAGPVNSDCLAKVLKALHREYQELNVLVTSRNELPIARVFKNLPMTSIEEKEVAGDISSFIISELESRMNSEGRGVLRIRSPTLKGTIITRLMEGSKGMFQWIRCQIDALCELRTDNDIRAALNSLPETLEKTYERILDRVNKRDSRFVRRTLFWLVRGVRDMSGNEMTTALAIRPFDSDTCLDEGDIPHVDEVLEALGGLVTTSPEGIVTLAHYSVKEYLESEELRATKPQFWVDKASVETILASACLTYLLYDAFDEAVLPDEEALIDRLEEHHFLKYAAEAWALHAQRSEQDGHQNEHVVDLTTRLLNAREDYCQNFNSWAEVCHQQHFGKHSSPSDFTPLYCAAFFGLTEAANMFLNGSENHVMSNCFLAAARNGHAKIVKLFLETTGPDLSPDPPLNLGKALYIATSNGHLEVIRTLLDHGVDIEARAGKDGNALQAAALAGQADAAELLLKRGASSAVPCKRYGTPLAAAAEKGHERTCTVLLNHRANPNGRGGWYSLPLVSAVVGKNINIIRLLIKKGAKLNSTGGHLGSALMAAAKQGNNDLVRELIDKGARVNDEDDKTSDALYTASLAGHLSTVDLLLELGADVNAKGGKHRNALGAASSEGHVKIVRRLLEANADVEYFDETSGNALQTAALRGHKDVVTLLASAGMDPSAPGGNKGSALVCAASSGQDEVIKALFKLGVEAGSNENTTSALVAAAIGGHDSTVKLMAVSGANTSDINIPSQTDAYCTPIQAAASRGHIGILRTLVELGCDVNATDEGWYGTALIAAVASKSRTTEIVTMLLDHGADPNLTASSECHYHGFPLVHAVQSGSVEVVKILLDRGADVNLQFGTVLNAVQMATIHEDQAILSMLIDKGADINLTTQPKDLDGSDVEAGLTAGPITPLQTAAWYGHTDTVNRLITLGAKLSVDIDGPTFKSALQVAAHNGYLETVKALLAAGADINEQGGLIGSALQCAIAERQTDVAIFLLEAGADANELDVGWYRTPLINAVCCGDERGPELIRFLVQRGADVNARAQNDVPFALHAAAQRTDFDKGFLEVLMELGADPNAQGGQYHTALQCAAQSGDNLTVEYLLKHGADPNITGGMFHSPLQASYKYGYYLVSGTLYKYGARNDLLGGLGGSAMGLGLGVSTGDEHFGCCPTLIQQLVTVRKFDVNTQYGRWGNALQNCIMCGREEVLSYMLNAGADVNKVGGKMGTALTAAAFQGVMDVVKRLLDLQAAVNLGNYRYPNAAFGAIRGREPGVLELLLKHGVDVIEAVGQFGTALQAAAGMGRDKEDSSLSMVKMLIEAGAPVNTKPCGRWGSPLQAAAAKGDKKVVEYLLDHGGDVNAKGGRFGSALNAATLQDDVSVVSVLLKKGAEITVSVGKKYSGPLQAAAAGGCTDTLLQLIDAGADIHRKGGKYCTALQAACVYGKLRNVRILVEHGAEMNAAGGYYGSAIQAALICQHDDVVRYLLRKGITLDQVDRKLVNNIAEFALDAADELLMEVKEGIADDETSDSGTDPQPLVTQKKTQDKQKPTRWDAVRGLSLPTLTKIVVLADVKAPAYFGEDIKEVAAPISLISGDEGISMGTRDRDGLATRPNLNRVARSMPIVPKPKLDDSPDIEWDVLTCLPVGEIAPVNSW
ncbi:uncharacterized protein JN550_005999 [Neoarthrinium moseri]|uniref:uncharacterized protein n=1 Tax=Neoarthrinium moseri TaxID=1658444 RepID=UPI001FDBB903|nr:uncharacterized protein JN550_005999 [Neoarthrinium moseri]KAI1869012.1 hypothetical protein JN550_005999 [Neoarthrinium moseri]